jgi:hypothetical protein
LQPALVHYACVRVRVRVRWCIDVLLTVSGTPQHTARTTCNNNNRQLGKLSALYSAPVVNKHLVPISLQLCQDAVSGVRKAAYMSVRYCCPPLRNPAPPCTDTRGRCARGGGHVIRWVR